MLSDRCDLAVMASSTLGLGYHVGYFGAFFLHADIGFGFAVGVIGGWISFARFLTP